ncbi:MAG: RNA polymerase sigma factor [Acidimicrobiia bacterium]
MRESVEGRPLDERNLIESAKNGDTRAFEQLVRTHQGIALRVAYLVVRNQSEAEDVTQDAFVKAYRSLARFQLESPFRPWLLRIVRNEALNRVRSTKRRERLALQVTRDPVSGDAASSPEAEVVWQEERGHLLGLIEDLPERYRSVLHCRYLLDLSEEETSETLGLPIGTVKSRNSRALQRLRKSLAVDDRDFK